MDFDRLEVEQVRVAIVSEQKSFLTVTNQDPAFIWNSEVSHVFSSLLRQSRLSVAEFGVAEFALCQRNIIEMRKDDQAGALGVTRQGA